MATRKRRLWFVVGAVIALAYFVIPYGCAPSKPEMVKPVVIPADEVDPEVWGKAYPEEFETWKKTEQSEPAGMSKYKRGFDADHMTYDKLAEYPYMALLFKGHARMLRDQLEVDASRLKAGGVCLSCKTPYAPKMQKELGVDYYAKPYKEILAKIPEKNRELGVACIDCHDAKDMSLKISRGFTLGEGLKAIGKNEKDMTRQEKRTAVCAQCHVTYSIPKDKEMHSVGLFFPWQGGKWGGISVENIIKVLRSNDANREWTQSVTGFKLAFIRHPEFELFSNNSVHWKAGASCADCHMPYTRVGSRKISDHRVMSPLKNDMKACTQCHAESAQWLREQVTAIQDRTMSMQLRAGYGTTTLAKLFELANKARAEGKVIDPALYDKARDYYEEAFYRSLFIGAENSVGFHNPTEAMRVLGDSVAFAAKGEGLLRQALATAGVNVPVKVDLQLAKYLDNRGSKKLNWDKKVEFKDPSGVQDMF